MDIIDYENLKKRGFLKQKQAGFFVLRTRISAGVFKKEQLDKIAEISEKFGQGFVHPTVRQGIEIPFIKFEDIIEVERELKSVGIEAGTSGPRVRATTVCPGNNWCKQGLVDTFSFAKKIEDLGIKCGKDLPHKFKIAVSGCPNACTRPQNSEIGVHGLTNGYAIYVGGSSGRAPRTALKLEKAFSEEEALSLIEKVVGFYSEHAKPRQRLGALMEEYGLDKFLNEVEK